MFNNFLFSLVPVIENDKTEWREILDDYSSEFGDRNPQIFWYLSSGLDLKALVHFNQTDTDRNYHTPCVDFFIYSDYSNTFPSIDGSKNMQELYDKLDFGEILMFEDNRTRITLDQIIPLSLFNEKERELLKIKYSKYPELPLSSASYIPKKIDFYYCYFSIESDYFGEEYFPMLWSSMENWSLMNEVLKKYQIPITYFCGACDGCRKGVELHGECVNKRYKEFFPVAREKFYWITDHGMEYDFKIIKDFKKWGRYFLSAGGGNIMYEINQGSGSG